MREIKFRAWDKDSKEMRLDVTPGPFSKIYPNEIWTDCGFTGEHGYLEDAILMQYTGLKDKNGEHEIYEGDKVKTPAGIGFIEWRNGCFYICWNEKEGTTLHDTHPDQLEVVGNIYEN